MIARTKVALLGLLALTIAACSDGTTSSPSVAPDSANDTVVTSTSTLGPISIPDTGQIVPQRDTTTTSATEVPTTRVAPTIAPSTTGPVGSSVPRATTTTVSLSAPDGAVRLVDKDCTADNGESAYDLLHVTVESLPSRYRLTARYSGDTFQHLIRISFDLGSSSYLVTGELFEDGNGVARIAPAGSSEAFFLDPPQTIAPGLVELTVGSDQIGAISGTPFAVEVLLKVDGAEIETCR